ncbi:hypothetical protein AVEN_74063-1 [Araneus ventricosus]|uniref:Uncharacterized protein n=1 Tax=Araneus ventricosus TaxID=182803 RepID=A0A4Y2KR62_ARAVE|nr:hypothetical protein AVEN_74063-1 [Araneus ventricosus]
MAPKVGIVEVPVAFVKSISRKPERHVRSEKEPVLTDEERRVPIKPCGRPHRICDTLGYFTCVIPVGARCCRGFQYDQKTNKCRKIH